MNHRSLEDAQEPDLPHKRSVEKMVFSPDCRTLAGICWPQEAKEVEEGSVVLWDIAALIQTGSHK